MNNTTRAKKRLQVFVSSTYEDMKVERQAAVEAILESGNIPAGMELFTSGNESQLTVIKKWIEECDVFLLLLGGRYGSIEKKSGYSYTELEYRHAEISGKPLFALVIHEEYLSQKVKNGTQFIERENTEKYNIFKSHILSKISAFYLGDAEKS